MGTIIGGKFFDDYAVEYNGVNQMHGLPAPPWKGDAQGAWAFDMTLIAAPPGTGNVGVPVLGVGIYLSNGVLNITCRRHTAYGDTNMRLDVLYNVDGVAGNNKANAGNTTIITPGTRYRCLVQSNGTIYINGVAQSLVSYNGFPWISGMWYSSLAGTASAYEQGFGGNKLPGQPVSVSGNVRLNNVIYYNAPLSAAEALADHNGGVSFDRRTNAALAAKLVEFWRFDGNGNAEVNPANNLTAYGTPTYIAP